MKRIQPIKIHAIIALLTCLAAFAQAESTTVSLNVPGSQLEIARNNGNVSLNNYRFLEQGVESSWIESENNVPLWTVTVLDSERKKRTLTAADAPSNARYENGILVMTWENVQPGNMSVRATVSKKDRGFEWGFECELHESGYTLWDVTYPEIGPLKNTDDFHAIIPYGWGYIPDNAKGWRHFGVYPSAARSMPFVGASDGKTGVYLGVHEPAGYPLGLFVGKYADQPCLSLGVRHDVEGMGRAVRYRLPYTVTTQTFAGDWYECARIYREAAFATPWGSVPNIAERGDIPQWLKDTDLWYIGACEDEKSANDILRFADYFGVPVSAHVYRWHEIPFDDRYPEYFPAKPGFKSALDKVQQAGIAVMPYINGRLWDPATESWNEKNAQTACAIAETGEKYVEVYGSKVPLSPMCPFTEIWQDTVTNLVDRLFNECGVKGVYIDQISAAAAKRCFADNHGHPVGGGTYWIQGYRDLIRRCQAVQPEGTAITTEENADPWNDLLQAWLLVNSPRQGGELVPLYPAVYSGRAVSFGFQYIQGSNFTKKYPFRLKMAQAFTFGSQLGWVGMQVLDPRFADEAKFLKRLCKARHAHRDALQYGDLLPPVRLEGTGTVSWLDDKDAKRERLAVLASAWLTPQGKRKIALANVSDEDKTVIVSLDERHVSDKNANAVALRVDNGNRITLKRDESSHWRGTIEVPSRDAFVVVMD